MCYAFDEMRQEPLEILVEVQQLGIDGLVLDFCRQPPVARYNARWVELFQQKGRQRSAKRDASPPQAVDALVSNSAPMS